jgi:hypothetical protein
MNKELYIDKATRDGVAQGLKLAKCKTVIRRTTGPQNIDPAYVVDADHSLNGEYRHYFKQLYAVEWED